jgi:peptide-methionine (R)-S-oxide reductase
MTYNNLTDDERHIIVGKGTEAPFSGQYDDFYKDGIYICRRCNNPLFTSKAKFDAHCGWPAFDDHFEGSVKRVPDSDGYRVEIRCANCDGHLGHVFEGEKLTDKDTRHCVNSLSIRFIAADQKAPVVIKEEK